MGNAGGLVGGLINNPNQMVGGLTNMALQQPFQGLVGMGMDAMGLAQGLPNNEQGPAQGPNTPIKRYPGMGYGPVGPAGGGLPPIPTGFLNKRVF